MKDSEAREFFLRFVHSPSWDVIAAELTREERDYLMPWEKRQDMDEIAKELRLA